MQTTLCSYFHHLCVPRLQPIGEAHIQGGRAGSLQDPQRRHGEECVRGGLHQHPHLPQQGNTYIVLCRNCSWVISWIHFPASDRHFLPLQPMMLRDFGVEPDDGENLRRIGRSLSGTVVTSRRSRLTATRSFVSVTTWALLPPCGYAVKLHLPDVLRSHCFSLCSSPPPPLFVLFLPFVLLFYLQSVLPLSSSLPLLSSVSLKGEAGRCQCLSLLTSSLLSPCCYSTTIISFILLITNTFSSPPPSTASQVNTALAHMMLHCVFRLHQEWIFGWLLYVPDKSILEQSKSLLLIF